jgi:DNA anti-recombination protein RmuC
MRIQGNFAMLQTAAQGAQSALAQVQQESDTWQRTVNQLAPEWQDGANAAFQEVHHARAQMDAAHQQMLQAFHQAIGTSITELGQALSTSSSRLGSVTV